MSLLHFSCGIEDYLYLRPVSSGDIRIRQNTDAVVVLPNFSTTEYYYFTNFAIYYRIYLSDMSETAEISSVDSMSRINPSLASDYSAMQTYTDSDSIGSTAIATQFRNRNYYTLELEGANINTVLGPNALGRELGIDFSSVPGRKPTIAINNNTYILFRSTGNSDFYPMPDRYFVNTAELRSREYAENSLYNEDVEDYATGGENDYAYVNMYILLQGSENYTYFYSRPTHIGVFRLP